MFLSSALNTLQQGLWTSVLFLGALILCTFMKIQNRVWVRGLMPFGYAITGTSFLFFSFEGLSVFKLSLGLVLLFFPYLFRGYLFDSINAMESQRDVARTLGASEFKFVFKVLLPQMYKPLQLCLLLLSLWSFCDYGLSLFVLNSDGNLGLVASSFMGSYRVNMSTAVTGVACLFAFGYFWLFDKLILRFLCRQ